MLWVSVFGKDTGAYAIVDRSHYQWRTLPHINLLLRQVGYVTDLRLVNSLLHCAPALVIDWIQITWATGRPQIWQKSVTFLYFRISHGNVATYCRWGGNLCRVFIENFLTNQLAKEFWKLVHTCQSYYQTKRLAFMRQSVHRPTHSTRWDNCNHTE